MVAGKFPLVNSAPELEALVRELGFLPLVDGGIEGFSVQACTPRGRWFVRDVEGPWEWREEIADRGNIAYGKFFRGKAGFIAPEWLPDFVNWRSHGMDFDTRYENGMVPRMEKQVMDLIRSQGPMLTRDLKRAFGEKGFDRTINALQMHMDATIQRFEYRRDPFGRPYGMGTGRIAPMDVAFGEDFIQSRFDNEPEISHVRLMDRLRALCPDAPEKGIISLIGK